MRASWLVLLLLGCAPKSAGPRPCPESNGPHCFLFSPQDTGLGGEGEAVDHIAVRADDTSRGQLLVFFNGSGGAPTAGAQVLRAAREVGLHAIALSYRSRAAVGTMCAGSDGCYEPTRVSQLTGELQPGSANELSNLESGEGIEPRLKAAIPKIAELDPDGGWAQFVENGDVKWSAVIVSGHSQGGGHAALIAKRHVVAKALMLASPCDAVASGDPATWLSSSNGWATEPSKLYGLWASGDETCPAAPEIWSALSIAGQDTGGACSGEAAHSAPLTCASNVAKWKAVLAP